MDTRKLKVKHFRIIDGTEFISETTIPKIEVLTSSANTSLSTRYAVGPP